jgi:hypothetical protein
VTLRHAVAAASLTLVFFAACSSSSSGGTERQCLPAPGAIDTAQPEVSFKTTIAPIVQRNCSLPACHGDPNNSLGIYLPSDAARIYESAKKPSTVNLKLDVVKAGAPNDSFLMHKVDGTQCGLDANCVKKDCGNVMPPDRPLSVDDRNAIRRWIAQGAKDN